MKNIQVFLIVLFGSIVVVAIVVPIILSLPAAQPSSKNLILTKGNSSVLKLQVRRAGGVKYDYRAGQIGHIVANGSPMLRRFFEAVLLRR